jgi:hypothetical protein
MPHLFLRLSRLLTLIALCACTMPYEAPVILKEPGQQPTANFYGLKDLIDGVTPREAPAQVLWAHGMCSHDQKWAFDRINRITTVLGVTPELSPIVPDPVQPYYVNARFTTPKGTLTITFLIWSPMTAAYKASLGFDKSGPNGDTSFPYIRASLNDQLKANLMNDCLSDAVVYAGSNGDAIRRAMQNAVCNFLGGVFTDREGTVGCDLSAADINRPVAIVTESLGSKFVFDAVRAIWDQETRPSVRQEKLKRRLAAISTVYLASNQIPLLDLANPITSASSSLEGFVAVRNRVRDQGIKPAPLTVVAFTDPNDLLTYRLLPKALGLQDAELVNVIVSNDKTYLGFVERPDFAHCGYAWNRNVIGLIANGYRAGGPVPIAPVLPSGECF